MGKEKFGVAVSDDVVQELDELVAECDDLGANRSEIVETTLTAHIYSETNSVEQIRELLIRQRKGTL